MSGNILQYFRVGLDVGAPQQIAQIAQKAGTGGAVGFGLWAWLAENAQAIGVLCAMIGAAVAVAGFIVNWVYQHKRSKGPPA